MGANLICDSVFEEHQTGEKHPEKPKRIAWILEGYREFSNSNWEWLDSDRKATRNELKYFHSEAYINKVKRASKNERSLDRDTPLSQKSYTTARLAAGSALKLTKRGIKRSESGFGAVRPPGHHASSDHGMGFCLFNNIVLAAKKATRSDCTVALVDIDVHHGNGTQDAFYDRADVLYVSIHQFPFYPGTGLPEETGAGEGQGYTLNITLPAGSDWSDLKPDWNNTIKQRLKTFNPDYLFVSAGFDGHRTDPIGGLNFTDDDYLEMARDLNNIADEFCNGRVLGLLEGGYNHQTLRRLVPKFTSELIG